jgi:hypothetical protein
LQIVGISFFLIVVWLHGFLHLPIPIYPCTEDLYTLVFVSYVCLYFFFRNPQNICSRL